jgi:hypothetical protein
MTTQGSETDLPPETPAVQLDIPPGETPGETPTAMTVSAVEPAESRPRRRWRIDPRDLAAVLSFVILAFWVTSRLWRDPSHGLADNEMDQAFFEWMLAHGARVTSEFAYPFVSYQMNVPDGINMMANTSAMAVTIPLTPVTLLLGPHIAFNAFLTGALIATATVWYFVLSRQVVSSRAAAWVGAAFCGFAPSMISHANGHPNIISQFVVPLIVWRTLALRQAGRWLRNGLVLALLIVWQAFINLEVLMMTAVGLAIFLAILAVARRDYRRYAPTFLAGVAVAGVVSSCLLAYPVYVQFFGPQAYHGLPPYIRRYGADLGSFVAFSRESVAGTPATAEGLTQNPTEENAFFGWPLAILVVALVVWLRRSIVAMGLAAVGLIFGLLSLGPDVTFHGRKLNVPSPWGLVVDVPVLNSAVPTRWALAIAPVVGILLALGYDRADGLARRYPSAARQIRFATVTILAMALLPIVPTTLPTHRLPPTPAFVTSGAWKRYVAGDRTVVTLPLPDGTYSDPIRWSAQTGQDMRIPRGYFLAPKNDPRRPYDRSALFSARIRPTSLFFDKVRQEGKIPVVTQKRRADMVRDLRYWRAGVVILAPQEHDDVLRTAMTQLTGMKPRADGGVWVWDVRRLIG